MIFDRRAEDETSARNVRFICKSTWCAKISRFGKAMEWQPTLASTRKLRIYGLGGVILDDVAQCPRQGVPPTIEENVDNFDNRSDNTS